MSQQTSRVRLHIYKRSTLYHATQQQHLNAISFEVTKSVWLLATLQGTNQCVGSGDEQVVGVNINMRRAVGRRGIRNNTDRMHSLDINCPT